MENLQGLLRSALATAESLPEKYQVAGFAEILRWMLEHDGVSSMAAAGTESSRSRERKDGIEGRGPMQGVPPAYIVSKNGDRGQQTAWAVARLAEKGEEANNESIRELIQTELSVTPQTRMDTNRSLKRLTPRYVRRERKGEGRGFRYLPTEKTGELFGGLEE